MVPLDASLRVLHVSTWGVPGRVAGYAGNLLAALGRRGVAGDVFPLHPHVWASDRAADVDRLRAEIVERAGRVDLVHLEHDHGLYGGGPGSRASSRTFGGILADILRAGTPVVTTFHAPPLGDRGRGGIAEALKAIGGVTRSATWRRRVASTYARSGGMAAAIVHAPAMLESLVRCGIPESAVRVLPEGDLPPSASRSAGGAVATSPECWDRIAEQTARVYGELMATAAANAPRHEAAAPLADLVRRTQGLQGWCPLEKAMALAELVVEARPECIVEIGVYGGRSAVPMAIAARTYGGVVHGVDPWSHAAALEGDVGAENAEWWGRLDLDAIYRGFLAGIRDFGVQDTVRVHRMTDTAALPMFADGSIGLLHVDGNHSAEVSMRYVGQWGPKVAPGGYLVMDDIDWESQAETVAFIERTYAPIRRETSWAIYRKERLPAGNSARNAA